MIISLPLRLSQLCANCEEITIMGAGSRCVVCGSIAVQPLSSILNPEAVMTFPQLVNQIVERKRGDN